MSAYNARLLDRIERAHSNHRWCRACGAPMAIIERDQGIWLACSSPRGTSRLARLVHRWAGHEAVELVQPREQELLVRMRRAELRVLRT